nr:chaperone protein dnaj 1, mitochondrial [Quercus suber]
MISFGPCLDMQQLTLTLTFDALQLWPSQIPKGVQPGRLLVLRGKGVDFGDTIRVPGAGNGGRGNRCGNLFIKLKVAEDPVFTRDSADIYVNSNISFTQNLGAFLPPVLMILDSLAYQRIKATHLGEIQLHHEGFSLSGTGLASLESLLSFKQKLNKKFKRRHSTESSSSAIIPSPSDLVRVPIHMAKLTDGDDSCTTPTSSLVDPIQGGAVGVLVYPLDIKVLL